MEKTYRIVRNRAGNFKVNCPLNGKSYGFLGSKKNFRDVKPIDEETYLWLLNSTSTFSDSELALEDEEDKEELKNQLYDEENDRIEKNTHTRKEVEELLTGNTNRMKKQLGEIEILEEKAFVMSVAQDIKLDSLAKTNFLAEWSKPKVKKEEK